MAIALGKSLLLVRSDVSAGNSLSAGASGTSGNAVGNAVNCNGWIQPLQLTAVSCISIFEATVSEIN